MTCTNFAQSLPSSLQLPKKFDRFPRRVGAFLLAIALPVGLLMAAHEIPAFGAWAADTLRKVVGTRGVAQLEDTVYSVRDSVNQVTRAGEQPRSYWQVPDVVSDKPSLARETVTLAPVVPKFAPEHIELPFPEVAAPGDGVWVDATTAKVGLKKTLIHPDAKRAWAELFVVAIDLSQVSLNWVPGTHEPENVSENSQKYQRTGRIPSELQGFVVGAFNGGFKTQHGKFGAQIDGITLVAPRPHSCTLAQTEDGQLLLGTHKNLDSRQKFKWLRQTPGCMIESGKIHPGLAREDTKNWGATLEGGTVIRRSAIGMSADRKILYMGISNDTTARALALGMQSAGADTVAQLDVNHSYPKFVLFDDGESGPTPRPLVEGFAFHEAQYLKPEGRDFFYLTKAP